MGIDVFLKVPHLLWAWNFIEHVPNSLRKKNLKSFISNLLEKWFFGLQTITSGKVFFFNFECYDLANGKEWVSKNWCTFRHMILLLEIPKEILILHQSPSFQEVLF